MDYNEIENKVSEYRKGLLEEYIRQNNDIQFKIGEVILFRQLVNGKICLKQYMYVRDVLLDNRGNFSTYILAHITPTGRISKNGFAFGDQNKLTFYFQGKSFIETITPRFDNLKQYKEWLQVQKKKKGMQ